VAHGEGGSNEFFGRTKAGNADESSHGERSTLTTSHRNGEANVGKELGMI